MDALIDMTGGIGHRVDLQDCDKEERASLYKHLLRTSSTGGFITCNKDVCRFDNILVGNSAMF